MKSLSIVGKSVAITINNGAQFRFDCVVDCAGVKREGYFHAASWRERSKPDLWLLLPETVIEHAEPLVRPAPVSSPPSRGLRLLHLISQTSEAWFRDMVAELLYAARHD